jgi:NADPH2:quinone reductase
VKAWVATTLDGEDGLELQELASPQCGREQIRIANHAVALNFPDVLITRGKYQLRLEPPFVPGSESAGIVTEVGTDVTGVAVGDRVLTVCGVGAFADEVVVTPSLQQVHIVPNAMPFTRPQVSGWCTGPRCTACVSAALCNPASRSSCSDPAAAAAAPRWGSLPQWAPGSSPGRHRRKSALSRQNSARTTS